MCSQYSSLEDNLPLLRPNAELLNLGHQSLSPMMHFLANLYATLGNIERRFRPSLNAQAGQYRG
jgi:hypothetical protein